jgi:hypothetical protein
LKVLKAIKRFNPTHQGTFGSELTDLKIHSFRIFQVHGTSLGRDRIEICLGGGGDPTTLGVFEVDSGGQLPSGSLADPLENAVIAALDRLYKRVLIDWAVGVFVLHQPPDNVQAITSSSAPPSTSCSNERIQRFSR